MNNLSSCLTYFRLTQWLLDLIRPQCCAHITPQLPITVSRNHHSVLASSAIRHPNLRLGLHPALSYSFLTDHFYLISLRFVASVRAQRNFDSLYKCIISPWWLTFPPLLKFELLYENPVAINLQLPRFMHWKWKALMSAFRMGFKLVGSIDWSAQQVHSHLSLATSGSHWQGHLNKTLCKLLTGCPSRRFCTSEKEQSQFNRSSLGRCKCPYVQACVFVCVREDMYMCMHG